MYYSNYGGMLYLSLGMHLAKLCKFEVLQVCQGEKLTIFSVVSTQKGFVRAYISFPLVHFKYMVPYQYTSPLLEDESGFIFTVGPRKLKLGFV